MNAGTWQALIEAALSAVWIVDGPTLRILAANRAAERLLQMAPGGFAGQLVTDLAIAPEDMFFWEEVAQGLSTQIFSETLMQRSDGTTIQVERRISRVVLAGDEIVHLLAVRDLSDLKRVEGELEQLVAELRATLESTADGILVTDLSGEIRSFNRRFAEMWNIPESLQTSRNDPAIFDWMAQNVMDVDAYQAEFALVLRSPLLETRDVVVLRSGRVLERVTLQQYARGRPIGRVFSFRDISQRLADEARLTLAAKVFDNSLDAIFVTDSDFKVVSANASCSRLTKFSAAEMVGQDARELLVDRNDVEFGHLLAERLAADGSWEGEIWHHTADGREAPCLVSLVRVVEEQGATVNYIGFIKDLSDAQAARLRIEELAYSDVLTGLPNRLRLADRIDHAILLGQREKMQFAILFLDMDRFKHINDSLGHQFGDRVLVEVARRISSCLRSVDTAARLGGDEFVLLLHQADAHGAEVCARRILAALAEPCRIDEMSFTLSCSIGIALFPEDGATMDDLIKNADSAMYHVKDRGRSDFRFYQRQMNIDLLARMKLDHAMRSTLAAEGFELHYQPQVDMQTGRIFGAEALIRWNDPELGFIPPDRFIPVAEETGVIVGIGNWVLHEALRTVSVWRASGLELEMAINVSALQFRQADFVTQVATALELFDVPPAALELELTESILVDDADEALKRLEELAALGVRLCIDDFGTGYSSLSYLKRFPLHRLKIDRSFVSSLPDDESDGAIVTAIINLARAMQLRVIAEGVETEAQRSFLLATGCQEYQGYLCSPAVPAARFLPLLAKQNN